MPEIYPYRRSYHHVAGAATEQTITGDEVPEGRVLRITNMALLNVTAAATLAKIGIVAGGREHWFDGVAALTLGACYGFDMDVLCYEGDAPRCKVDPTAENDEFYLYVNGEWWFVGQGGERPVE